MKYIQASKSIMELQKNYLGHLGTQRDFTKIFRSLEKIMELLQIHKNYLGHPGTQRDLQSL